MLPPALKLKWSKESPVKRSRVTLMRRCFWPPRLRSAEFLRGGLSEVTLMTSSSAGGEDNNFRIS